MCLLDRDIGTDGYGIAAAKQPLFGRYDTRSDQREARLLAHKLAPYHAGGRENVDHAIKCRAGRLRQRQDHGIDGTGVCHSRGLCLWHEWIDFSKNRSAENLCSDLVSRASAAPFQGRRTNQWRSIMSTQTSVMESPAIINGLDVNAA